MHHCAPPRRHPSLLLLVLLLRRPLLHVLLLRIVLRILIRVGIRVRHLPARRLEYALRRTNTNTPQERAREMEGAEWVEVCGPPTHCPLYVHPSECCMASMRAVFMLLMN